MPNNEINAELLSCLIAYVELEEQAAPYSSSPMRERARAVIAKVNAPLQPMTREEQVNDPRR